MSDKLKVLVVTPPTSSREPALMTQYFLQGRFETVELLPLASPKPGLFSLLSGVIAARLRQKPDVLYFTPSRAGTGALLRDCVVLISIRWMFPATVLHLHFGDFPGWFAGLSAPLKVLFKRAFERPDVAIVLTREGARDAEFIHARQTAVVPYGIPDVWEDGPRHYRDPVPVILFFAAVSEENGVGVLIEACKILQAKGVKFRCKIAGPASSEEGLAKLREQAGELGGIIQFAGPAEGEAKWEIFAEGDVFCFPTASADEPFGLAALEAMMSGLPLVASSWRALPDLIAEGKTGFVISGRDAKAIADKLSRLLRDSILRQVMGNASRHRYLDHYRVEIFREGMEGALSLAGVAKVEKPKN